MGTSRPKNSRILSDRGFTLVELLIVTAIAGFLIFVGTQAISDYNRRSMFNRVVTSRNELQNQLTLYARSMPALQTSAAASPWMTAAGMSPNNDNLRACLGLNGPLGAPCLSNLALPLTLFPPGAKTVADAVSGTDSTTGANPNPALPRYYSTTGTACAQSMTAPTASCPLEVTTFFIAQCKPDGTNGLQPAISCTSQAEVIKIFYRIQQGDSTHVIDLGMASAGSATATLGQLQQVFNSVVVDPSS